MKKLVGSCFGYDLWLLFETILRFIFFLNYTYIKLFGVFDIWLRFFLAVCELSAVWLPKNSCIIVFSFSTLQEFWIFQFFLIACSSCVHRSYEIAVFFWLIGVKIEILAFSLLLLCTWLYFIIQPLNLINIWFLPLFQVIR